MLVLRARVRWEFNLRTVLLRPQLRKYGYVHVPKKRTPHLLGFGSEWRKCFVVHPHTQTSRPLENYQWLTGTIIEEGLPASLSRVKSRAEVVAWFEERVKAAVSEQREGEGRRWRNGKKSVENMQQILFSALTGLWMSGEEHLRTSSLTFGPRVECFWRCAGYNFLCVSHPLLILHCTQPLDLFSDPTHLHHTFMLPVHHHPRYLGLFEHSFDQITPFAGCHRFSPTPFTHTVFCMDQRARSHEQLLAHGLMQLFSQAAAECVQNGYPLGQDLAYPLASQGVLTDGHSLTFLTYQLNTLDLRIEEGRRNVMWVGPTLELLSGRDINRECSDLLVQFILHCPARKRPALSGFGLKRGISRI